jgi:hypothetical protein
MLSCFIYGRAWVSIRRHGRSVGVVAVPMSLCQALPALAQDFTT